MPTAWGIERTKKHEELNCSFRSPKVNHDYGTVVWNSTAKTTKNSWHSTPTNMDHSVNSNLIMNHLNEEDKKGVQQ